MCEPLTLADYKLAKGITDNSNDSQYNSLISMANQAIETYCGRSFGVSEHSETKEGIVDHLGRYFFVVKNLPVIEVSAITLKFIGVPDTISLDVSKLDILHKQGYAYYYADFLYTGVVIRPEYRSNFTYTINYRAGEKNIPEDVKLAAVMMVSDTFEYLKRTSSPGVIDGSTDEVGELKSVKIGDYQESYATSDSIYAKFHAGAKEGVVLSATVRSLLLPYKRLGQNVI